MKINFTPLSALNTAFVVVAFILITSEQAAAQIVDTRNTHLKAETKRSRKEAAKIEADYKETHLNTIDLTYKKGEASHKRAKAQTRWDTYQDERYDDVIYTESARRKNNRKISLRKLTGFISI